VTQNRTNDEPLFLTTTGFAKRLGVSKATVKRACDAGRLAYIVITERGDRRIPASEVDRLRAEADAKRSECLDATSQSILETLNGVTDATSEV
jgi:excisionase family DNA binding protein